MKIDIVSTVPASRDATWALVMDIPRAATCIPGIKEITQESEDKYQATLQAKVGPMGMTLSGTITVLSQDYDAGEAYFLVEADDRRVGGGVKTNMSMKVSAKSPDETELEIEADTTFMGRLGELGQALVRRKARNTLEEFAKSLNKVVEAQSR